mmetsp:Transcript_20406/g.26466  ORF Transcript_20406/g.26466 Transcript_20406/m.26466 type:complete len:418 (-) Transcript_20406:17-1270(-)|eukprot:CAMPEP_0197299922 /NCGR_PEP_ID=MMETSP0890-20130614/47122_1 /TAXON_ID=44058 ORGANISM="Aureoumbra lagunensis, Strain CCMP1510" /NCGR_SAMPLE_ID=MMETSP0890 /ASSEMBLY_ACC=CAM_ASM_000533 /LENGTH=417 /DNA_ID=CAMNT_0042778473 /DNA_START=24 /DNA_END=1277 /DNA_ORIENTATION=-
MSSRPVVFFEIDVGSRPAGRVEMELYTDIVPRTAQNFLCLCTGELGPKLCYAGSPIHRIIRDFMIQGGDIVKRDGTGSISIFGETFDDENFRMKHDRPFLLSMANAGKDTNGSQFFLTVRPTPHLDGKHVVFGHIVKGQQVVLAISNLATDAQDRPKVSVEISASGQVEHDIVSIQHRSEDFDKIQLSSSPQQQVEADDPDEDDDFREESAITSGTNMNDRERRLFKIRLALNRSRKANAQALKDDKRRKAHVNSTNIEERKIYETKQKRELEVRGLSSEQAYLIDSTHNALRRQNALDRKQKNKVAAFGWEMYNQDTQTRAYDKRLDDLPISIPDGNDGSDEEASQEVKPEAVDRMVVELEAKQKRAGASLRRRRDTGTDVDYINKRNKHFNQKIKRAFDSYTTEIRQNLERGTAI